MRVRMLNRPEDIAWMNREFVPVAINLTDQGFPEGVPALAKWREAYQDLAWSHMSFGCFVVVDPEGENVLGHSTCQALRRKAFSSGRQILERSRSEFDRAETLRKKALESDPSATRELQKFYSGLKVRRGEILPCLDDHRLITARYVVSARWLMVLEVLSHDPSRPKRPVEGKVFPMAVRALGQFLSDDRPFSRLSESHFVDIAAALQEGAWPLAPDEPGPSSSRSESSRSRESYTPPPWVLSALHRRCAVSLGRFLGKPWKGDDPEVVETARRWWAEHQKDPLYQVSFARQKGPTRIATENHLADDREKGIRWAESLGAAMDLAKEAQKPVFVALSVRLNADPKSPEQ